MRGRGGSYRGHSGSRLFRGDAASSNRIEDDDAADGEAAHRAEGHHLGEAGAEPQAVVKKSAKGTDDSDYVQPAGSTHVIGRVRAQAKLEQDRD
jgi:hypothetical protein